MPNNNTAAFPSSLATDSTLFVAAAGAASTLSSGINSSVTSAAVNLGSVFPYPCLIQIDTEFIAVGSVSGNTLGTLTRGFAGSTAASHALGAAVTAYSFPYLFNQQNAEIKAIEAALGANLANVLTPSQTMIQSFDFPAAVVNPGIEGFAPVSLLNLPNSTNAPIPVADDNTSGNGSLYAMLQFEDSNYCQGHFTLPPDAVVSGNISVTAVWRTGAVAGTVQWGCELGYLGSGSIAPDLPFGSPVTSTGTVPAVSNTPVYTTITLPMPSGINAGNELFWKFFRGASDSAGAANLISLQFNVIRSPF